MRIIAKLSIGPYAQFGIIDNYDENCNYAKYKPGKYNFVSIPDDIINDWWEAFLSMESRPLDYPIHHTALDRWGVTIIPPESLPLFIKIVSSKNLLKHRYRYEYRNRPRYRRRYKRKLSRMLNDLMLLLKKAHAENKYIIHYGI